MLSEPARSEPARSEPAAARAYRIARPFAAVHFEPSGKGRIVFLPAGAELLVVGESRIDGCSEVLYENRRYAVFKADLTGPGSNPILPLRGVRAGKSLCSATC
jgi:hypothetical protein